MADWIRNRWDGIRMIAVNSMSLGHFIAQVHEYDSNYVVPEHVLARFMFTFKEFTRGHAKVNYLTRMNEHHTLSELIEEAKKVFTGGDVPHPNLFPADPLFEPGQKHDVRLVELCETLRNIIQRWRMAEKEDNLHHFKLLESGASPLVSFNLKFEVYPIWKNPEYYRELLRQTKGTGNNLFFNNLKKFYFINNSNNFK